MPVQLEFVGLVRLRCQVLIVVLQSALELEFATQRVASQRLSQHSTSLLFGRTEALGM